MAAAVNITSILAKENHLLQRQFKRLAKTKSKYNAKASASESVQQYLESKSCLKLVKEFLPQQFLRIKKVPSFYTFVVDDEIAGQIISLFEEQIKGCSFAEGCPGLGLLSRKILSAGAKNVLLFDPRPITLLPLQKLINDNLEKLLVIPRVVDAIPSLIVQDNKDGGDRLETIFSNVIYRQWHEEPALKLVAVAHNTALLRFFMRSICFPTEIIKLGRIELFYLVTDNMFKKILSPTTWGRIHNRVLLQALFDVKILGQFPRKAFLPWDKGKIDINDRVVHLVQITPRPDTYQIYTTDELKVFWYFIHAITRSKDNSVIRIFENYAPGSGVKLIYEGISPMTLVSDLTTAEIVYLFKIFITLPDFDLLEFMHIEEISYMQDIEEDLPDKQEEPEEHDPQEENAEIP